MNPSLLEYAQRYEAEIIKYRRVIHSKPELGMNEYETSRFVAQILEELGVEKIEGVGKTGVVGLIHGDLPGKTVALRADMDALPIKEENDIEYKSVNEGVMHACGHDAHTAMLLGAASILTEVKNQLKGTVKLIFQPSEEGPVSGAKQLVKEGVLDNPRVDAIFGIHVNPAFLAGTIGYKDGVIMAGGDGFEIEVIGKGGHASTPNLTIDPIVIASDVINSIQKITSRIADPFIPLVISIGTISGGTKANVIPDKVTMTGSVRTLDDDLRKKVPVIMENMIQSIVKAYGGDYRFEYRRGAMPLKNDSVMNGIVKNAAERVVEKRNFKPTEALLAGEDFVFYTQKVPAAFAFLGTGFIDRKNYPLHSSKFELDEKALPIGAAFLAQLALDFLS